MSFMHTHKEEVGRQGPLWLSKQTDDGKVDRILKSVNNNIRQVQIRKYL